MTSTIETTAPAKAQKSRKRRIAVIVAAFAVTLLAGVAIGGGGSSTAAAPTVAPDPVRTTVTAHQTVPQYLTQTVTAPPPAPVTETVTVAPAAPVVVGPAEEITRSGIYVAGSDIKAGKWKTTGGGYFAILADPTGSTSDTDNILTNDNPDGQAFATLEEGQGLETTGMHWTYIG